MAAALATVTVTDVDNTQKYEIVHFTVAVNANPATYTTGGNVCSFSGFDQIKATSPATRILCWSQPAAASPNTSEFVYSILPGTTLANGVFQVFTGAAAQSALTELSAGAVPAGVSGDTIVGVAWFKRI